MPLAPAHNAAAKLFLTVGKLLDTPGAGRDKVAVYFQRLLILSKDKSCSSRTRFMLQDLIGEWYKNKELATKAERSAKRKVQYAAKSDAQKKEDSAKRKEQ
ncbi:hypothetical protein M885DRAFT_572211 [Pelagophyceae sp. CCMP2097]|nr:hypothetical protein M885DRAFT_572211 [Pelagophyceae sp. CCMP2097]